MAGGTIRKVCTPRDGFTVAEFERIFTMRADGIRSVGDNRITAVRGVRPVGDKRYNSASTIAMIRC